MFASKISWEMRKTIEVEWDVEKYIDLILILI